MSDATELRLEFQFEGGLAGYFLMQAYPHEPGVFPYMPFRSGSHYRMGEQLRQFGHAECSFVTPEGPVRFKVVACPEYGWLELSDFAVEVLHEAH